MGACLARCKSLCSYCNRRKIKLVLFGLANSGKTSILYRVKLGTGFTTIPTLGCNVETVRVRGWHVELWDVGGQENLRSQWTSFAASSDGVIYVVDSLALQLHEHDNTSTERRELELELEAFYTLMSTAQLRGLPLLILANKQDLPGALSADQIAELLQLEELRSERECIVQPASAVTGEGLEAGLRWLVQRCVRRAKSTTPAALTPAAPSTAAPRAADDEQNSTTHSAGEGAAGASANGKQPLIPLVERSHAQLEIEMIEMSIPRGASGKTERTEAEAGSGCELGVGVGGFGVRRGAGEKAYLDDYMHTAPAPAPVPEPESVGVGEDAGDGDGDIKLGSRPLLRQTLEPDEAVASQSTARGAHVTPPERA